MKPVFGALFIIAIITIIGLILGIYTAYKAPRGRFIFVILIAICVIAIIGFGLALKTTYTAHKQIFTINQLRHQLESKQKMIESVNLKQPRQLLFIHHSVGWSWLSEGGLAESLIEQGLGVHDATYGDFIGEQTDLNHWVPKFKNYMDRVFTFNYHPDIYYGGNQENDIIMFKSCFPNSDIVDAGDEPGDAVSPVKTLNNYKATFRELKKEFAKYPEKSFIYVTAPPLVPAATTAENAARAREFNNWVKSDFIEEYKAATGLENFLVFDFFDVLADKDNFLNREFRNGERDSHPNAKGTRQATELFIQFLKSRGIVGDS